MIAKDKILKSAKAVEEQINILKETILKMCDDLDSQKEIEKKEIIRLAIIKSIEDLNGMIEDHSRLITQI